MTKRKGDKLSVSALTCRCSHNHPKSPTGFGCGTDWLIGATYDLDNPDRKVNFYAPDPKEQAEYLQNSGKLLQPKRRRP